MHTCMLMGRRFQPVKYAYAYMHVCMHACIHAYMHTLMGRRVKPVKYAYGSRGPAGADELARRYGMSKFGGGLTPYVFLGPTPPDATS